MSLCVLLIEHEDSALHQLGRGLRDADYLVMPLNDADSALDLLGLVSFDLVLADVATLRYAGRHGGNGLTALVRLLRGSPLLLFSLADTPSGADDAILALGPPARPLPGLLAAIERLIQQAPAPVQRKAALAGVRFDMGDVDDLAFPPFFQLEDEDRRRAAF